MMIQMDIYLPILETLVMGDGDSLKGKTQKRPLTS